MLILHTIDNTPENDMATDTTRTELGITVVPGTTVRTIRGTNCRATYHPEWSPSKPWSVYIDGAAVNNFATLEQACARIVKAGGRLPVGLNIVN